MRNIHTHRQPWLNDRIKQELVLRRTLECKWLNDQAEYNFQAFYYQMWHISNVIKTVKKQYYISKLHENRNNFKQIFGDFFKVKIDTVMSDLKDNTTINTQDEFIEHTPLTNLTLTKFQPVTIECVEKLLSNDANKMCQLDPIPTNIVKVISGSISPSLRDIINTSLTSTTFTSDLKQALLKQLLKKADLPLIFKNYRLVSNLSYVSKLIEHVVFDQLTEYTARTGNAEPLQLAYWKIHSTETAVLRIKTDILQLLDKKKVTCLILLDLSAAFDPVDHKLLLHTLEHRFGIKDTALNWIRDYLTNRTQQVVLDNPNGEAIQLKPTILTWEVPQGSVLGPLLFTLYTSPLGDLCCKHVISFHCYADDQQNYLGFKPTVPGDDRQCLDRLEHCISDIRAWMKLNYWS